MILLSIIIALHMHTDAFSPPASFTSSNTATHSLFNSKQIIHQRSTSLFELHLSQSTQDVEIHSSNSNQSTQEQIIEEDSPTPNNNANLGAWIPLGSASSLADITPVQIKVCGLDLAVWHNSTSTKGNRRKGEDGNRKFSAFIDACPHRLAPLSQGRVDPETNCLQCPYHGWEFDTDGTLTAIPQLEDNELTSEWKHTIGAATSLPVHAAGDLLFVFIPSDVCGESWPIEMLPENQYPYLRNEMEKGKQYLARELPYSADFLIENFMDPAHIPFAHHSLQGTREDGSPIKMELVASNFTHIEASFIDICRGKQREGVLSFQRPAFFHFRTKINETSSEYRNNLSIYLAQVQPGKCRIMMPEFSIPFLPTFLSHAASNRFLNTDTWLHDAERNARLENNSMNQLGGSLAVGAAKSGRKPLNELNYLVASNSDLGPSIFRKWWTTHLASGPAAFFGPAPSSAFSGKNALSRAEQIDPWIHHSKNCAKCRKSLRVMKMLQKVSVGVAASLAIVLRRRRVLAIASIVAGLWAKNFLEKLCTVIEGNNHRSEIGDRSVSAMK